MKLLLSCVGNRDPVVLDPTTKQESEGALVTAIRFILPDETYLLPTKKSTPQGIDTEKNARKTIEYVKAKVSKDINMAILPLNLDDPTDYQRLSDLMLHHISSIKATWQDLNPEYHISISSGTAQMQAVWLMLHSVGMINAKLWQVVEPRFAPGDSPELRTRPIERANLLEKYLIEPLRHKLEQVRSRLENIQARRLEEQVGEYLRTKYSYTDIVVGFKAPFLHGKEVDVYARKVAGNERFVTVTECKLRVTPKHTTLEEIKKFAEKVNLAKEHETNVANTEGSNLVFKAYFVSNYANVESEAKELAGKEKIKLYLASLPSNWMDRSDWKITSLKE